MEVVQRSRGIVMEERTLEDHKSRVDPTSKVKGKEVLSAMSKGNDE